MTLDLLKRMLAFIHHYKPYSCQEADEILIALEAERKRIEKLEALADEWRGSCKGAPIKGHIAEDGIFEYAAEGEEKKG